MGSHSKTHTHTHTHNTHTHTYTHIHSLTHTHTHTDTHSVGVLSGCRRDLYVTTHNTHNRQISMPLDGFESALQVVERPQIGILDRATTWTGLTCPTAILISIWHTVHKLYQLFVCCDSIPNAIAAVLI